jgi:hypothetical protein
LESFSLLLFGGVFGGVNIFRKGGGEILEQCLVFYSVILVMIIRARRNSF